MWACRWATFFLVSQAVPSATTHHQTFLSNFEAGSLGCGVSPASAPGKSQNFSLYSQHGGGQREYLLHLPSNYKPDRPHALILSYHGFTQNMFYQELISKFSNSTINPHAVTVYPQALGSPPAWQGAPYSLKDVDDIVFTTDLIAHLKSNYCIEEKEIYVSGMSNGGGFANTLACSHHGRKFAAFAAVAGAFYGDVEHGNVKCEPTQLPIPMLEIHGDEDGIIPYRGGKASGVAVPAIRDWLRRWASRNGCSDSSAGKVRDLVGGNVLETSYSCNGRKGIVMGLRVNGMGHVWPSKTPSDDNGNVTTWIDAAPFILNFFEKHRNARLSGSFRPDDIRKSLSERDTDS